MAVSLEHRGQAVEPDGIGSSSNAVSAPSSTDPMMKKDDLAKLATPQDVDSPERKVHVKRMLGELEVAVSWDRSHVYFPGLRTVVAFRLVG